MLQQPVEALRGKRVFQPALQPACLPWLFYEKGGLCCRGLSAVVTMTVQAITAVASLRTQGQENNGGPPVGAIDINISTLRTHMVTHGVLNLI